MLSKNRLPHHSSIYGVLFLSIHFILTLAFVLPVTESYAQKQPGQPVHADSAFLQDLSIKYKPLNPATALVNACADRNGSIRVFSSAGVLLPHNGQFLYPGSLRPDNRYRTTVTKKDTGIDQSLWSICTHRR